MDKVIQAIQQVNDRITAMDTKFTDRFDHLEDKVDKILTLPTVQREMKVMYPKCPEVTSFIILTTKFNTFN